MSRHGKALELLNDLLGCPSGSRGTFVITDLLEQVGEYMEQETAAGNLVEGSEFLQDYVRDAMRTEVTNFKGIAVRMNGAYWPNNAGVKEPSNEDIMMLRIFHFAIGMVTEIGEFFDTIKKHVWYRQSLDLKNLVEELGDLSWYMAGLIDALGLDWATVMENNIAKLRKRFPDKFTEHDAEHRDLHAEMAEIAFSKSAQDDRESELRQVLRGLLKKERDQLRGLVELAANENNWWNGSHCQDTWVGGGEDGFYLRATAAKVLEGMSVEDANKELEKEALEDDDAEA